MSDFADVEQCLAFQERQALIKAAVAGDSGAQLRLAHVFRMGDDLTPRDLGEAAKWYRLAADAGNPKAANDFGVCLLDGVGIAADIDEAVRWIRIAAAAGVPEAQMNLGLRYLHGRGAPQDDV